MISIGFMETLNMLGDYYTNLRFAGWQKIHHRPCTAVYEGEP